MWYTVYSMDRVRDDSKYRQETVLYCTKNTVDRAVLLYRFIKPYYNTVLLFVDHTGL